jgi:hypothetical protein
VAKSKQRARRIKRKRRAKRSIETVLPQPAPLIDLGSTVAVTVKSASAEEIVYKLSDGTKLKLRPIIMSIERAKQKYNPAGEPIYQLQTGLIVQPIVPKKLKRKGKQP